MVCYRLTHIRLIELIEAIEKGDIEAVKQHLAAGADVNAKDDFDEWTALHAAVFYYHKEIADLLRKHGGKMGEELKAEGK